MASCKTASMIMCLDTCIFSTAPAISTFGAILVSLLLLSAFAVIFTLVFTTYKLIKLLLASFNRRGRISIRIKRSASGHRVQPLSWIIDSSDGDRHRSFHRQNTENNKRELWQSQMKEMRAEYIQELRANDKLAPGKNDSFIDQLDSFLESNSSSKKLASFRSKHSRRFPSFKRYELVQCQVCNKEIMVSGGWLIRRKQKTWRGRVARTSCTSSVRPCTRTTARIPYSVHYVTTDLNNMKSLLREKPLLLPEATKRLEILFERLHRASK